MQRTDLANPPEVRVAHSPMLETNAPSAQSGTRKRGFALPMLAALVLLVVAAASALFLYRGAHDGRVYRGVRVLGADIGGMSKDEASKALASAVAGYPGGRVAVNGAGHTWSFAPADLGLSVDTGKTVDNALLYGRASDFVSNVGAEISGLLSGTQVAPVLKHNNAMVDRVVAQVAAETEKPAVSSKLQQGSDGKVQITASSNGATLDRDALRTSLLAALDARPLGSASITMRDTTPKITEAALRGSEAQALVLTEQPLTLKSGKQTWTLDPEDLRGMLSLSAAPDGSWNALLDKNALANYLKPVAAKVEVDPKNATVVIGKGTVTLKPDVAGKELDTEATLNNMLKAAASTDGGARTVTATLKDTTASVQTDQVKAIYDKANTLVTQGIRLHTQDDGYTLRGTSVTGFLDVAHAQGGPGPLKLTIDEDVLSSRISGVAYNINRQPTDARFRMVNGTPTKLNSGNDGLKVNVAGSVANTEKAIEAFSGTDRLQVDLDVAVTPATIKDADMSSINTPDVLGFGQTSYAGSSPERKWNVELGTSNVNGSLIPPDGVFSTVDNIGDLTLAAGFKMGYAIVHTDKGLTTIPAEAGGICQVSTTLFHSVFRAGLPIVERNWHSYWIALYGRPPSGLQGLDATISPPEKDFRFKNTTGHWLRVEAIADGTNVTFKLYGVNPGWTVKISDPVITNNVKTDTNMITEKSDALPVGKTVLVEHAQDGFDSSITRVVSDSSGNVVDKWTARSHYQPAHNRTLVGTGSAK